MPNVKLESYDEIIFEVDIEVAKQSMLIKSFIEDLGLTEDEPIPLPNVSAEILTIIIEWATYHKDDPPYVKNENADTRTDNISEWDRNFVKKLNREILIELMLAANYLDIKGLLDVSIKTIANIEGKTPEEILEDYEIPPATESK